MSGNNPNCLAQSTALMGGDRPSRSWRGDRQPSRGTRRRIAIPSSVIDHVSPAIADSPVVAAPESDRAALRLSVAVRDYPVILFFAGALVVLFSVLTYFTEPQPSAITHAVDGVVAVFLLAIGVLFRWGALRDDLQPWIFAGVGTVFTLSLLYEVTILENPIYLTYVAIVMCALGPCTLAWRPFMVTSAIVLVATVPVTVTWPTGRWADWTLVIAASIVVSGVLLGARLRGINALADSTTFARQLASTDQLTGLLNRHGLLSHVRGLVATAERLDQAVFVVFVDIRGLKLANDQFGHEFGDRVIQAAARAVSKSVRAGDLVARWGGDEIVIIGIGRILEAEAFNDRLQGQHEWTGPDKQLWSGDLSVGFSEGLPSLAAVDHLISCADEDMYRRRDLA